MRDPIECDAATCDGAMEAAEAAEDAPALVYYLSLKHPDQSLKHPEPSPLGRGHKRTRLLEATEPREVAPMC